MEPQCRRKFPQSAFRRTFAPRRRSSVAVDPLFGSPDERLTDRHPVSSPASLKSTVPCFPTKSTAFSGLRVGLMGRSDITQPSDFTLRSYPNEPLDSSATTSLAAIHAFLAALPARRDANPAPKASGTTIPAPLPCRVNPCPTQIINVSLDRDGDSRCTHRGGTPNRRIRSKIAAHSSPGTATSAIWNVTYLACRTAFAPILIRCSHSVVNDPCFMDHGNSRRRRKFPRRCANGNSRFRVCGCFRAVPWRTFRRRTALEKCPASRPTNAPIAAPQTRPGTGRRSSDPHRRHHRSRTRPGRH